MESINNKESSNPPINDLIFRELMKRKFIIEGETRLWNLADSKLWYLTNKQAQNFINLEHSEEYRKSITDREVGLLTEHTPEVLQVLKETHYNIVDLGCGDGKKAALLIKKLRNNFRLRYCPIDISSYMVQAAAQTIRNLNMGDVLQFHWNISDFENLTNVTPLLREGNFQSNFLLLLGNTLGNFDRDDILNGIRQTMQGKDALLIGNGLNSTSEDEIVKPYQSESTNNFLSQIVQLIGLNPEDLEYNARFKYDEHSQNSRVECFYKLKKDKSINHLSRSVEFKSGDEILVAISYKFTREQLDAYLKRFFGRVNIYPDDKKAYAIAMCSIT